MFLCSNHTVSILHYLKQSLCAAAPTNESSRAINMRYVWLFGVYTESSKSLLWLEVINCQSGRKQEWVSSRREKLTSAFIFFFV